MPKAPKSSAPDDITQDDPKDVAAIEKMRAKLDRLSKEAEQLGEAMRQKPKKSR
jgi:hypothetical protein